MWEFVFWLCGVLMRLISINNSSSAPLILRNVELHLIQKSYVTHLEGKLTLLVTLKENLKTDACSIPRSK